jgi:hypothetical protein
LKLFSVLRRELKSFCFAEKWEEEDEVVEWKRTQFSFRLHRISSFTSGTAVWEERKVFMSNYPSLIKHYLLVTCFYCFRISFSDMREHQTKTIMCHWDSVLWHWAVKLSTRYSQMESLLELFNVDVTRATQKSFSLVA